MKKLIALVSLFVTATALAGPPIIFKGPAAHLLTKKLESSDAKFSWSGSALDLDGSLRVRGLTATGILKNDASGNVTTGNIAATNEYYVDGGIGSDTTGNGSANAPYATIQKALDTVGQPVTKSDAMRHIKIFIADSPTSLPGNSPATFNGVYAENLTVPNRWITMYGAGVKIGDTGSGSGHGNIIKEYSTSRRFGAGSSEFRPTLTLVGVNQARDNHPRLRNGFHVEGTLRTAILRRNLDSIQGDGVNKITVQVAAGQFYYPITIPTTYPTEPRIRINVSGTSVYNGNYDITAKIDDTTFEATRVSGTNANTGVEVAGVFFESDSAGASGLTHDSHLINTYMQGAYTCDDGTVNGAAPTAGTEVFYAIGTRFFTGVEGRTITMQRWDGNTLNGYTLVSAIEGLFNSTISGTITTNTFTYSTDDPGLMNNKFNGATVFTVNNAAQTVRMDGVTYTSFLASGSSWAGNTPTVSMLNQDRATGNTSSITGTTVAAALNTIYSGDFTPNGFRLGTSGAQPTCDVSRRGLVWNVQGGAGVADVLQVCQKNAADAYAWTNQ